MTIERSDITVTTKRLYAGTYIVRVDTFARDETDGAGGVFCQAFTVSRRRTRWVVNPPPIFARSEITFDTLSEAREGCLSMVARFVVPSFRELAGFEFYRSAGGNLVYTGEKNIGGLTCYISVERDPQPGSAWSILVSRGALVHVEATAPSHPQINDAVRRALDVARTVIETHQAAVVIPPDAAAEIAQVTAEAARLRAENEERETQHDAEIAAIGALFNAPPAEPESFSAQYLAFAVNTEARLALEEPARDPQDTTNVAMDAPDWLVSDPPAAPTRCTRCGGTGDVYDGGLFMWRNCPDCSGHGVIPVPESLCHDAQAVLGFAQELIRAVAARQPLNAHQQQAFAELYSLARAYDRWAEETKGEES